MSTAAEKFTLLDKPPAVIAPIYMWAGGKSRLLKQYSAAAVFPSCDGYTTYIEPFFGGGAVWGAKVLNHDSATIGDINGEITSMLKSLKGAPDAFIAATKKDAALYMGAEDRKSWYKEYLKNYWEEQEPHQLYLLLKTCFNGIWQTNKASGGLFATPPGLLNHKSIDSVANVAKLTAFAQGLQRTNIYNGSYEGVPVSSESKALIYLDPPYRDSYTAYGTGWSDSMLEDLCSWYLRQVSAGHAVLLANRCIEGDGFFEERLGHAADFHYFDVTYTAGRRKQENGEFSAMKAREFLAVSRA